MSKEHSLNTFYNNILNNRTYLKNNKNRISRGLRIQVVQDILYRYFRFRTMILNTIAQTAVAVKSRDYLWNNQKEVESTCVIENLDARVNNKV